jgi:predicted DCC family thiol-disulfide oxidoreductase YuxK
VNEYRWPVIAVAAIVVLALFFGFNYYRQHYLYQERFLEKLQEMEAIQSAAIKEENGAAVLEIIPAEDYRGSLKEMMDEIGAIAAAYGHADQAVKLVDRRNQVLDSFAAAASPALYEGARRNNYRSVAATIYELAETYRLEEVSFVVDSRHLYLQARDGDYYLYQVIPLEKQEGKI